jgi:hypothetical protein
MSFSSCTECVYCKNERPAGCSEFYRQCFGRWRNGEVKDRAAAKDVETGEEVAGSFCLSLLPLLFVLTALETMQEPSSASPPLLDTLSSSNLPALLCPPRRISSPSLL